MNFTENCALHELQAVKCVGTEFRDQGWGVYLHPGKYKESLFSEHTVRNRNKNRNRNMNSGSTKTTNNEIIH